MDVKYALFWVKNVTILKDLLNICMKLTLIGKRVRLKFFLDGL